jgi:hypothetical protein
MSTLAALHSGPQDEAMLVRPCLDQLLRSSVLSGSERPIELLRFLVDRTLAGRPENLKETVIGVKVWRSRISRILYCRSLRRSLSLIDAPNAPECGFIYTSIAPGLQWDWSGTGL